MKLLKWCILGLFFSSNLLTMKFPLDVGGGDSSFDPNDPKWVRQIYVVRTYVYTKESDGSVIHIDVKFEECPAWQSNKSNYARQVGTPEGIAREFVRWNESSGILSVQSIHGFDYKSLHIKFKESVLGVLTSLTMLRTYKEQNSQSDSIFSKIVFDENYNTTTSVDDWLKSMQEHATSLFADSDKEQALSIMLGKEEGKLEEGRLVYYPVTRRGKIDNN